MRLSSTKSFKSVSLPAATVEILAASNAR